MGPGQLPALRIFGIVAAIGVLAIAALVGVLYVERRSELIVPTPVRSKIRVSPSDWNLTAALLLLTGQYGMTGATRCPVPLMPKCPYRSVHARLGDFRQSTESRPVSITRIVQRRAAIQNAWRRPVEQNL
jgi:hypothetical protein